jgi:hypothetical protein
MFIELASRRVNPSLPFALVVPSNPNLIKSCVFFVQEVMIEAFLFLAAPLVVK